MAKATDTFFIRQSLTLPTPTAFAQQAIDLGSFVDALGKSILRIKSCSIMYSDSNGVANVILPANGATFSTFWQLTTQSQSALIRADDRALISSGALTMATNNANVVEFANEVTDINPSNWHDGYLVATEAIYLGGQTVGTPASGTVDVSIVLECEVTSMSQSAAMALALSQQ